MIKEKMIPSQIMEKKRIIFTVTSNLENDQRVHKTALYFHNNGWNVKVIGSQNVRCNPNYAQPYQTHRINVLFKKGFLFYAEFNIRLFFLLLFSRTDRIWANDTDTALAGFIASKIKRTEYTQDLHELFPEVPEVTHRKNVKAVWTKIEDLVFPHIKDGYTVCQSIADYYKTKYKIDLKVLRNVPYYKPYTGKRNEFANLKGKIILYQGAVNEGRGIEWIIDAMEYVENATFVIIGGGDIVDEIRERISKKGVSDKVIMMGRLPFSELEKYTLSADLGVCLLKEKGLSYYFSLPNRIFDFMQAHVPILATQFPEIEKIVVNYRTGRVINHYEPQYLAQQINEMLAMEINHEDYEKASQLFNWERECRNNLH